MIEKIPPKGFISLTNVCNASCIFCSYPYIRKEGKTYFMSEESFSKAVNLLYSLGFEYIDLTPLTGEIFLHSLWYKFLKELVNNDRTKGVFFYTNAILLNAENSRKLLDLLNLEKLNPLLFPLVDLRKLLIKLCL